LVNLTYVENITLSHNRIREIPDWIGTTLPNLKELSLEWNQIETIPISINKSSLEWIVIEDNPIKDIPDDVLGNENLNIMLYFDNMQEVMPGLFIGSHFFEKNMKNELKNKGVSHILFLVHKSLPSHPEDFIYKKYEIEDSETQEISHMLDEAIQYIEDGLKSGKVFVNCECGISRSATVIIAYLMFTMNMSYEEAFLLLRKKRHVVKPNRGFKRQLIAWKQQKALLN